MGLSAALPPQREEGRFAQKWLKPRPKSGLDCLICAELARQRLMNYEVTSLTGIRTTLGPYSMPMPRALWWS